jgi:CPA2 family monovalent cation:H+ antiporter-2
VHADPWTPVFAAMALALFALGYLLRRLRQPSIVAYLLVGVLVGPHAAGILTDEAAVSRLGGIGLVLLLFFVGMEVAPHRLLESWRVTVLGTLVQVLASLACVWALGVVLDWPAARIVLLGFVISLSSTAVAVRLVKDRGLEGRPLGEHVIGILLVQDVALVPMLVTLSLLNASRPSLGETALQCLGAAAILAAFVWIARRRELRLGLGRLVAGDRELQVFVGLIVCFSFAFLAGLFGLSSALGAFLAGVLVAAARETEWIHETLEPFRVVFVALFFVSVGMLLDLGFLRDHLGMLAGLTVLVLATNTFVNAGILRVFAHTWRDGVLGGAMLAQVGELSFVLAAAGRHGGLVSEFAYQATMAVITLSLLVSPLWLAAIERLHCRPRAGESRAPRGADRPGAR